MAVTQSRVMQNILFVTDLAPDALAAAGAAAARAKKQGARLILLHAYQPEIAEEAVLELAENEHSLSAETDNLQEAKTEAPERNLQKKLDVLANQLHHEYQISVTRLLQPNLAAPAILMLAQQLNADLYEAKIMAPEASLITNVPERNYPLATS